MKHLIDEFKKTASFFQRYTPNLRPIKYVDYENSITFSCMRNSVELVILFKCIDDNNTISCSVSVTDYTTCGEPIQTMKTKVLHSENAFVIKFNSEELDELLDFAEEDEDLMEVSRYQVLLNQLHQRIVGLNGQATTSN